MDWTQAFFIVGALGTFTFWLFTKLDADVRSSNQRVDNLYSMFCQMQKEIKDLYVAWEKEKK